jgi:release factor glutamine methyltransferase
MKMSKDILPFFKSELQSIYSENEIDSLAFRCIDSIFKFSRSQWLLKSNYPLSTDLVNSFEEVVSRLKKHEPIQYIFGECEFNGLMFKSVQPV